MHPRLLLLVLAACSSLLAACGGERESASLDKPTASTAARTPATAGTVAAPLLSPPATALADPALCQAAASTSTGPLGYRLQGGRCWRSSDALGISATAGPDRRRALAAPSRLVTPNELFNWAEQTYPTLFPSRQSTLQLASFEYRYYPEARNHLAVSAGLVYVQGAVTDGVLALVGSLSDFTCVAMPSLCGAAPADCAPATQWRAGLFNCSPDAGQTARIPHGASFSFTDNSGPAYGVATYRCENGTLQAQGTPSCSSQAPAACNTAGLSWSVGGNVCTPNATEPAQIASGETYTFTDAVQTNGLARYRCHNGTLSPVDAPSCNPRPAVNCTPNDVTWSVSGNSCSATSKPVEVALGSAYAFVDSAAGPTGRAVFRCTGIDLVLEGTPTCEPGRVQDSFGGDGGPADGGASGDGTAADGAPLVGASVRVTDIQGREATATTDSNGYWRVRLTGMLPPMLIRVAHPDGRVRHSVNLQVPRPNAYIFMAVTGLTDQIVSDIARQADLPGAAALSPGNVLSLGTGIVNTMLTGLRNNPVVRNELVAAGLNPDTFDPLNTPFRPDGTGYDKVLDNLVVDVVDGQTVLRSKTCSINQVSWTVNGNTCSAGSSTVTIRLSPGSTLNLQDSSGSTRGSATFACVRGLPEPIVSSCTLQQ